MSGTHSVTVDLLGNMAFRAITDTGHEVRMDAAPEVGGTDTGPRPMELLLVGPGGCTDMDVISMLRKMRQDVTAYEVHVSAERATEHPKIFTSICCAAGWFTNSTSPRAELYPPIVGSV